MADHFTIEKDSDSGLIRLGGILDLYGVEKAHKAIIKVAGKGKQADIDISGLTKLDTVGAMLLSDLQKKGNRITHIRDDQKSLFDLVAKSDITPPKPLKRDTPGVRLIKRLGRKTIISYESTIELITFLGKSTVFLARALTSPKRLRFGSIMHHIEETGMQAIPIVALIAFLISIVLAYQGVAQLRPLGAQHLTVNLVAISVLREMGVLLTAIMVAGRSGSAFAAEIGVMKVREEVDALTVIGIRPFEILVIPRLLALMITLPLLTFIADMMGLLGGGIIGNLLIDVSFSQYIDKVREVAHPRDFAVGMIKAPVFALLIGTVGCLHGLKVSGSAESVGHETTASVVKGIFLVLVADAFFSIFFDKIGL